MINYFFEEIDKVEIHSKTSEWLENLIQTENKKPGEINYIFCDDDYLLKVNQDYLDHDYYTDITTYRDWETDRKSTRLNSSHRSLSRMPSSA